MKTPWRITFGAALAAMMLAGSAYAQGTGQGLVGSNCKAEIAAFCVSVPHQRGAVPKCLEQYDTELSQNCQWALAKKGPAGVKAWTAWVEWAEWME